VPDFAARGVRSVHVIGNAFDPDVHRPMDAREVGPDFERFDVVFAGYVEDDRRRAINGLAAAGLRVVVYGAARQWGGMHANVTLRPPAYHVDYSRAMHTGKVALCFLRKINHDTVTTRSVEIPAMARPMVAERTDEHDALFADGREYVGFSSADELISAVRRLVDDEPRREQLRLAGRSRCLTAGYSTIDRAREMLDLVEARTSRPRAVAS